MKKKNTSLIFFCILILLILIFAGSVFAVKKLASPVVKADESGINEALNVRIERPGLHKAQNIRRFTPT